MSYAEKVCSNPFVEELFHDNDTLYHLNLNTKTHNLPEIFGKVRIVVTGGSKGRVTSIARMLHEKYAPDSALVDYADGAGRFSLFCVDQR